MAVGRNRTYRAETSSGLPVSDSIHSRSTATAFSSTMLVASCGIWPGPRRVMRERRTDRSARVHPYRVNVMPGDSADAAMIVRNFLDVPTVYEVKLACPPGIWIDPSVATLRVEAGGFR
jgi:hypothetical protein